MVIYCPKCESPCHEEDGHCPVCGHFLQSFSDMGMGDFGEIEEAAKTETDAAKKESKEKPKRCDHIFCPFCHRRIIPQCVYSFDGFIFLGAFGIIFNGMRRYCPLCGKLIQKERDIGWTILSTVLFIALVVCLFALFFY